MPRIRFIFPAATKFRVLGCLIIGQRNSISPPPRGGDPRFFICQDRDDAKYAPTQKKGVCLREARGLRKFRTFEGVGGRPSAEDPPEARYQ